MEFLKPGQFAEALSNKNRFVTLAGVISEDECESSNFLSQLVHESHRISIALARLLPRDNGFQGFAELAHAFLLTRCQEEYSESSETDEHEKLLGSLRSAALSMDYSFDWAELATKGDCDGCKSIEALANLYRKFHSYDLLIMAISVACVALAHRLYQVGDLNTALVPAFFATSFVSGALGYSNGEKSSLSENGSKAATIRHGKPGGSHDRAAQIRELWASGRFGSRDHCAEQECAALGMSFSTARNHLRNTEDPNPWPAKGSK